MTQSTGTIMQLDEDNNLVESKLEILSNEEDYYKALEQIAEIWETYSTHCIRPNEMFLEHYNYNTQETTYNVNGITYASSNPFTCARILLDIKQQKLDYQRLELGRQARVSISIKCRICERYINSKYCQKCGFNN